MRRLLLVLLLAVVVVPSSASAGTRAAPEAEDECGVAEVTETYDLTSPDAPWADLCAAWIDTTTVDGALESVTVTAQLAGNVAERTHTSTWAIQLNEGDCDHVFFVADDGVAPGELRTRQTTSCGYTPAACSEPFPTIEKLLDELGVGSSCSAEGTWRSVDGVDVPASAVSFGSDTVSVTLNRVQLSPSARERLVPGTTIKSLEARASFGAGVATGGSREHLMLDMDFAFSTGRAYTIPE